MKIECIEKNIIPGRLFKSFSNKQKVCLKNKHSKLLSFFNNKTKPIIIAVTWSISASLSQLYNSISLASSQFKDITRCAFSD